MAHPRTVTSDRGARNRSLGNLVVSAAAPKLLAANTAWCNRTKAAYKAYGASETVKALRTEDTFTAYRLFEIIDHLNRVIAKLGAGDLSAKDEHAAFLTVRTIQSVVAQMSAELGIGPRARLSLGLPTGPKIGSRLEAFRADGGEDV